MKSLIVLAVGLLAVGCWKPSKERAKEEENRRLKAQLENKKESPTNSSEQNTAKANTVKELTPEEKKAVGSYEAKKSAKHVLLENGKSETWILGVKRHGGTWKIDGKEVHIGIEKLTHVCKIEPNGDLILIAKISDGKRTDVAKENQFILEKSNN